MVIRKATREDCRAIRQVAETTWHHTYEGIIPSVIQERFLQAAYSDEALERRIGASLFLVAEEGREVVGFAHYSKVDEGNSASLFSIYVLPAFHGKRIGSRLLQEGIRNLDGIQALTVDVEKENGSGMVFYKSRGFQKTEEFTEELYGHRLQTVRMRLLLTEEKGGRMT